MGVGAGSAEGGNRWAARASPDHALGRGLVGLVASQKSMALGTEDRKRQDGGDHVRRRPRLVALHAAAQGVPLFGERTEAANEEEDDPRLDPNRCAHFFLPVILSTFGPGFASSRIAASMAALILPPASASFLT